jgi:hypothetical protein
VDRAVREQAGEAAPAGVEQALLATDVEKGLLLAGEAGRGQILGSGGASNGQADVLAVLSAELAVRGADLRGEQLGNACPVDDLPGALRPSGQICDVVGAQLVEHAVKRTPGSGLLEHEAIAVRGDGEAVRHPDPPFGQFPVHLPEGCVLAADHRHVGDADLVEEPDVS